MRTRWLAALAALALTQAAQTKPPDVKSLRLYVFDCGTLTPNREGVERYHVTLAEVGETRMPVPCFLIAHPRGTLMWDVGVIPTRSSRRRRRARKRTSIRRWLRW